MNNIYYKRYTISNHMGQRDTKNVSIAFIHHEGYKELPEGEKINFTHSHWKMDTDKIQTLENIKGVPYISGRRAQSFEVLDMVELNRRISRADLSECV